MRRILLTLSAFAAFAATSAFAQSITLVGEDFHEKWHESAQISGALVMGVQRQGIIGNQVRPEVVVPRSWQGQQFCLRVVSIDGRYEAINNYQVSPNWSGGAAPVPFLTKDAEALRVQGAEKLSLHASLGPCDAPQNEATIAQWQGGSGGALTILINAFRADAVFIYIGDALEPIACEELPLGNRTAFDTICILPETPVVNKAKLEIHRIVNRKPVPPTEAKIWFNAVQP